MASTKGAEYNKESTEETQNDSSLNPVSAVTVQQEEDFTSSCPAILEPSEDDPLFKREKIKRPLKTYKAIMQSYNSTDILVNSDEPSNELTTRTRPSVCVDLFNRYKNFALKFRNSNLIYIFHIWLSLLSFSAIMMGNTYAKSCPGSPDLITFTVLTGIFGVLLTGQWIALECCPAADRPCEGQQKCGILFFFLLVLTLLEIEIYLFCTFSPSFEPSTVNYCSKVFYYYTYYKFIAAFGSVFLVVLLYLPGYSTLASGVDCSDPVTGRCYKGAMEEENDENCTS